MDINFLLIIVGLFVPGVVLFKRELLLERRPFLIVLAASVLLFIAGLMFHFTGAARHSASGALLAPLISLGFYCFSRRIFVKLVMHEPKDTADDWTPGKVEDRLFNIVYFTASFLLAALLASGMQELAKRGW